MALAFTRADSSRLSFRQRPPAHPGAGCSASFWRHAGSWVEAAALGCACWVGRWSAEGPHRHIRRENQLAERVARYEAPAFSPAAAGDSSIGIPVSAFCAWISGGMRFRTQEAPVVVFGLAGSARPLASTRSCWRGRHKFSPWCWAPRSYGSAVLLFVRGRPEGARLRLTSLRPTNSRPRSSPPATPARHRERQRWPPWLNQSFHRLRPGNS